MKKAAELSFGMVIVIIVGLFVLALLLVYIFATPGGPKNLIDAMLGFLGNQTQYIQARTSQF